jgi:hypothetical protein
MKYKNLSITKTLLNLYHLDLNLHLQGQMLQCLVTVLDKNILIPRKDNYEDVEETMEHKFETFKT